MTDKLRCFGQGDVIYSNYHDNEWGKPVRDDRTLFEFITLEGAQAGLSWITILKRREAYRDAFHHFNIDKIAQMSDDDLQDILQNSGVVRNRLKVFSTRKNALVAQNIIVEFGSLATYIWQFVDNKTRVNTWQSLDKMPVTTAESDALSQDLKKRGMSFVGSTIMYAFMQAVGLVDDHIASCWIRQQKK